VIQGVLKYAQVIQRPLSQRNSFGCENITNPSRAERLFHLVVLAALLAEGWFNANCRARFQLDLKRRQDYLETPITTCTRLPAKCACQPYFGKIPVAHYCPLGYLHYFRGFFHSEATELVSGSSTTLACL
jgi:hypothetical protein